MNNSSPIMQQIAANLGARHRKEARFRAYGLAAIGFAGLMLIILLVSIIKPGLSGFTRYELKLDIDAAPYSQALATNPDNIDFYTHTQAIARSTLDNGPRNPAERHALAALLGFFAADEAKKQTLAHPQQWHDAVPVWVPLASNVDMLLKGKIDRHGNPATRPITDQQLNWIEQWEKQGRIRRSINWDFFRHGDSRAPEAASFGGSIVGSLLTLVICLGLALPIAIAAAITLEEFAGKSRLSSWLEVTINNLAAVPSILYGLLGLSIFLQLLHLPRSSALVGGLTLAVLILPVMIIAARAAIRAVPPSMRLAATGLGATPLQVVRHHVLPYAWPGIMTGTILSICRALGETAPLLMIGMVAFVADVPHGFNTATTSMPVEIYLWATSPEQGFVEKTSSGILVLLLILLLLNLGAIRLRNRSQLTWN